MPLKCHCYTRTHRCNQQLQRAVTQPLTRVKVNKFQHKTPHPQKPLNLQTLHLLPPHHNLINRNLAHELHLAKQHKDINSDKVDFQKTTTSSRLFQWRRKCMGTLSNLTIRSQHFPRIQNPNNAEPKEKNLKEKRNNDGCQYQY